MGSEASRLSARVRSEDVCVSGKCPQKVIVSVTLCEGEDLPGDPTQWWPTSGEGGRSGDGGAKRTKVVARVLVPPEDSASEGEREGAPRREEVFASVPVPSPEEVPCASAVSKQLERELCKIAASDMLSRKERQAALKGELDKLKEEKLRAEGELLAHLARVSGGEDPTLMDAGLVTDGVSTIRVTATKKPPSEVRARIAKASLAAVERVLQSDGDTRLSERERQRASELVERVKARKRKPSKWTVASVPLPKCKRAVEGAARWMAEAARRGTVTDDGKETAVDVPDEGQGEEKDAEKMLGVEVALAREPGSDRGSGGDGGGGGGGGGGDEVDALVRMLSNANGGEAAELQEESGGGGGGGAARAAALLRAVPGALKRTAAAWVEQRNEEIERFISEKERDERELAALAAVVCPGMMGLSVSDRFSVKVAIE